MYRYKTGTMVDIYHAIGDIGKKEIELYGVKKKKIYDFLKLLPPKHLSNVGSINTLFVEEYPEMDCGWGCDWYYHSGSLRLRIRRKMGDYCRTSKAINLYFKWGQSWRELLWVLLHEIGHARHSNNLLLVGREDLAENYASNMMKKASTLWWGRPTR